MARISVVGTPFEAILLHDLDQVQRLREHTINPPGQERYIKPVDVAAIQAVLDSHNAGAGTTETAEDLVAATLGADDISQTAIQGAVASVTLTQDELDAITDLLSVRLVETGNFMLSFDRGVISKLIEKGWVKVFTETGEALYTL